MSYTHVTWHCYGTVNTDDPEDVKRWIALQQALSNAVRVASDPMWSEGGEGTLRIMHDGVGLP